MSIPYQHSPRGATQSPVDPASLSHGAALLVRMIAASAATLAVVLPVAFFHSYFMNDLIARSDHVRFLWTVTCALLVLATFNAATAWARTGLPLWRCLGSGLATASFLPLLLGSLYALLNVLPALDSAVGYTATDATCLLLAATLGIASAVALASGRRLLLGR